MLLVQFSTKHCWSLPMFGGKIRPKPISQIWFLLIFQQCRCNHTWRLMTGSQAFWVILVLWSIFWVGKVKAFLSLWNILSMDFPVVSEMSYSVNIYFPIFAPFWVWDRFLGGTGSGWDRTKVFCSFWNFLYMDFPMVFDTTILNEHPFLIILKGRTNLWVGWEVDGVGQFFLS